MGWYTTGYAQSLLYRGYGYVYKDTIVSGCDYVYVTTNKNVRPNDPYYWFIGKKKTNESIVYVSETFDESLTPIGNPQTITINNDYNSAGQVFANRGGWYETNVPMFYSDDTTNINKYINDGDWSGAINAEDLGEKLYAKWYVAYTNENNTKYSIAVDCPQFADPTSTFYGKGSIARVYMHATYTALGQTVDYDTKLNYGQTWSADLSDIVNTAGGTFAEYVAKQLSSILDLDNLTITFYVAIPAENPADATSSAIGYVVFDHNEVDDYGFQSETHGDTITFRAGEVLSDDDSNTSNAEIEIADGDDVPDGEVPDVTGANLLTTSYSATPSQIQGIGAFLWGANFMTNVLLLNNSPIENIVGCKLFPLEFSGTQQEIKIGNVASGTNGEKLATSVFSRESSAVSVSPYYTGNLKYLDYAPYSKLEIFLPFVGLRELPLDECINHKVKIKWIIDVITGTLQTDVMITHDGNDSKFVTIQTYVSTIGVDIPLTAQNRAQVESAYIANAIHGGVSVASGNVAGAIGAIANIATTQYHTNSTGTPSSATAIAGTLSPFLLRTVPRVKEIGDSSNDTYRQILGAPCNKACKLGTLKGYTEVENPSIAVAGATSREVEELNRLLREGVFL